APGHLGRGGPRHLGPPGPGDPLLVHARAPGRRRLLDGRRRPAVGRSPPGPVAVPRHRRAAAEAPQARLRHRPLTGKCPADRPEQHFPERKGRAPKAPPRRPGGRWGAEPPNGYSTGKCPADRPEQHFPERKGRAPKAPPRRPGGRWGAEPPNCYLAVAAS